MPARRSGAGIAGRRFFGETVRSFRFFEKFRIPAAGRPKKCRRQGRPFRIREDGFPASLRTYSRACLCAPAWDRPVLSRPVLWRRDGHRLRKIVAHVFRESVVPTGGEKIVRTRTGRSTARSGIALPVRGSGMPDGRAVCPANPRFPSSDGTMRTKYEKAGSVLPIRRTDPAFFDGRFGGEPLRRTVLPLFSSLRPDRGRSGRRPTGGGSAGSCRI